MKTSFRLLSTLLLLSSCTSREELAATHFEAAGEEINAVLYSEDFLNPDGLVGRTIELSYPGREKMEWELHTAHYSDSVQLKMLEGDGQYFLIAEDSTGYSAWNLQSKRVSTENGIGDSGNKGESGTARDYMAHEALSKEQWARVLGLSSAERIKLTAIYWQ